MVRAPSAESDNRGGLRRGARDARRPRSYASELDDDDVRSLLDRQDIEGALRRIIKSHGEAIYNYCYKSLNDNELADDVRQLVFIQAFRDLPKFEGRSSLRTWLLSIARNRILDAAKKQRTLNSRFMLANVTAIPDPGPASDDLVDTADLYHVLAECLNMIEESARTAVLLRYYDGFEYEEMAKICGVHSNTLQMRVARALPKLRRCIEDRLGVHDESQREKGISP